MGAFGAEDLEDQDPPPTLTVAEERTAEDFKSASSYGQNGDGSLRAFGPSALFVGVAGQKIQVDVTNVGSSEATYVVRASGVDAVAATTSVTLPGNSTERVTLPVDDARVHVGTGTLALTLTAAQSTDPLANDSLTITVPDLTDPAVRAQAEEALRQLSTLEGIDPAVRSGLVEATSSALGVGQLDRITLTPANPSTTAGQPVQFAVTAIDTRGGTIRDVTANAQLSVASPATCRTGSCSATKPGATR